MRFAGALLLVAAVWGQERYDGDAVLEINAADSVSFERADAYFQANSYDLWRSSPGEKSMHVRVPEGRKEEVNTLLKHLNVSTTMYISDVQKLIENQFEAANLTAGEDPFFTQWRTLDQVLAFTRQLANNYDNVEFIPSIGRTIQGRDIFALKIGGQDGGADGRAIYFQGGLHCREWVGISTTMYIAWSLLTSTDPEIVAMLRQLQVVIVPVVNADGFVFTHTNSRLWRKNRRQNTGTTCIGVDLNRNWDDHWSGPGSSPNPCSDIYHGTAPFSEPETKAVELFLMNDVGQRKHLIGAIDFHAFGQLILRPYGWCLPRDGVPENNEELRALGARMQTAIRDTHGLTYRNEHAAQLYVAAGGADDWFYSVATHRSAGYCIELRDTGRSGFVLPPAQIIPTGQEAFAAMKPFMRHMLDKPLP